MIFADASALMSIIMGDAQSREIADRLEGERVRLCSALSVSETVASLCDSHMFSVSAARAHVRLFLEAANFRIVSIGERELEMAADAFAQYGEGRHPAGLSMSACYAYACAKVNRAKLLFTGGGFALTDLGGQAFRA
ncbi:type II toxin-antitoxin system VapC family toxin [Methylocella tundrae]|uniref:Ribonuclease VapC n=1 Tax=Methylocella tundrae TaxID=227605 RepID=A0A4U8Z7K7_METTU|nr:type II toxin-antitoxin system VapC family toxin [Methylocella tundrae]WPP02787.1 type II toxin-antitoxin system VapC family toxin [Methylocella tundrae]VFU17582.1 Ribonuclease VapC [Methylocella tundrae]